MVAIHAFSTGFITMRAMCKVPKLCLTHCFLVPASPVGLSSPNCSLGNVGVKLILSNTLDGVVPGTLAEKSILFQVMTSCQC